MAESTSTSTQNHAVRNEIISTQVLAQELATAIAPAIERGNSAYLMLRGIKSFAARYRIAGLSSDTEQKILAWQIQDEVEIITDFTAPAVDQPLAAILATRFFQHLGAHVAVAPAAPVVPAPTPSAAPETSA